MTLFYRSVVASVALALMCLPSFAQGKPGESGIPAEFKAPKVDYNYTKRVEMIPSPQCSITRLHRQQRPSVGLRSHRSI
jgi:hypothetical protein